MAKPPHPDSHSQRIKDAIDKALVEEVLLPCPDRATADLVRSRIYYYLRAHRAWATEQYPAMKQLKTKISPAEKVRALRSNYTHDIIAFPYVIVIDTKDAGDVALDNMVTTSDVVPMTRATTPDRSMSDMSSPFFEDEGVDDEETEDEYMSQFDKYLP